MSFPVPPKIKLSLRKFTRVGKRPIPIDNSTHAGHDMSVEAPSTLIHNHSQSGQSIDVGGLGVSSAAVGPFDSQYSTSY